MFNYMETDPKIDRYSYSKGMEVYTRLWKRSKQGHVLREVSGKWFRE